MHSRSIYISSGHRFSISSASSPLVIMMKVFVVGDDTVVSSPKDRTCNPSPGLSLVWSTSICRRLGGFPNEDPSREDLDGYPHVA